MKKQLYLYMFIFSFVINFFIYMYYSGQLKHNEARIAGMQAKIKKAENDLKACKEDADYFSFFSNDNALDYFTDQGINDTNALAVTVEEGIMNLNQKPGGNPLTGYEPLNGQKFLINKIKILNNRWVIADFSNGTAWGDVLIKYFVDDKGVVTYETMQTLLYANTIK